jgi:DNA repair protein RadC
VEDLLAAGPRRLRALGFSVRARRRLRAVAELARRYQPAFQPPRPVLGPRDALSYLGWLRAEAREVVAVLLLDAGFAVMGGPLRIAEGAVARVAIEAREVFAPALERHASALVLAHNHPSGTLAPSENDMKFTKEMLAAGEVLGVPVLDHLLVARRGYLSFAELGLMSRPISVRVAS